jgi:Rab family, other
LKESRKPNMHYKLKIIMCGPAAVGKTSLVQRYINNKFGSDYKLTVGVDISTKDLDYPPGDKTTLNLWDVGGQERFEMIRTTYYKGAAGAFIIFDLSRKDTWIEMKKWREELRKYAGDIPFILIGNKVDLITEKTGKIDRKECKAYAKTEKTLYFETSAKENVYVKEAFFELMKQIHA